MSYGAGRDELTRTHRPAPGTALATTLRETVARLFPAAARDLESLVRVPSVSNAAFDQAHVAASADAVAALLRDAGLPEVQVLRARAEDGTEGAPAVVARRPAPDGAPTVLLYAHHDVQPRATRARGRPTRSSPPSATAVSTAAARPTTRRASWPTSAPCVPSWRSATSRRVTVFVEGEEEIGSPTFLPFLTQHRDLLAADVIVVADSSNWKIGVPALTTSLRGLVDCEVEVAVLDHAVHSACSAGPCSTP